MRVGGSTVPESMSKNDTVILHERPRFASVKQINKLKPGRSLLPFTSRLPDLDFTDTRRLGALLIPRSIHQIASAL